MSMVVRQDDIPRYLQMSSKKINILIPWFLENEFLKMQAFSSCARMFENDSTLTLRLQTLTNEANIGNSEKLRTLQKLMKLFLQKGNKKDARLNNYI